MARLPSMGFAGSPSNFDVSSMMKKSLKLEHTYSGYSELKKYEPMLNELALVGTRISSVSITGSLTELPPGCGQPGALGNLPPFASSHDGGTPPSAPAGCMSVPGCHGIHAGSSWSTAGPVDSTAIESPKRGTS